MVSVTKSVICKSKQNHKGSFRRANKASFTNFLLLLCCITEAGNIASARQVRPPQNYELVPFDVLLLC